MCQILVQQKKTKQQEAKWEKREPRWLIYSTEYVGVVSTIIFSLVAFVLPELKHLMSTRWLSRGGNILLRFFSSFFESMCYVFAFTAVPWNLLFMELSMVIISQWLAIQIR